jgi:hypothetical protein
LKTVLVVVAGLLAVSLASLAGVIVWARGHVPTESAWDDPAIASCEWLAQQEDVFPAQEYRRVSASIEGSRVLLAFTVEALHTKPEPLTKICEFELNDTTVLFARPKSAANCDAEVAAVKAGQRSQALKVQLDTCIDRMKQHLDALLSQLQTELPLALTGVYPIDRAKTRLSFN